MVEDDAFVRRWTRRKDAVRREESDPATLESPEGTAPAAGEIDENTANSQSDVAPEDLPDIDSLDEQSDYRVFMKEGVPEELRTRALRKLWRSNPIFGEMDGLDEYCEDFTDAALAVKGSLKSIYKVGQGYAKDKAPAVADAELEEPREPTIEQADVGATEAAEADEEAPTEVENATVAENADTGENDDSDAIEKS
ncbi:MAG: DUF3306 domain-containing protein [Alphaproteobacteria bacterium]|nr:DUF3306 domain-containing protein [Alphaproteobacteria bacterium]